jgi:hypothetical protein
MYACSRRGITDRHVRPVGQVGSTAPGALSTVLKLDHPANRRRCVEELQVRREPARAGAPAVPVQSHAGRARPGSPRPPRRDVVRSPA